MNNSNQPLTRDEPHELLMKHHAGEHEFVEARLARLDLPKQIAVFIDGGEANDTAVFQLVNVVICHALHQEEFARIQAFVCESAEAAKSWQYRPQLWFVWPTVVQTLERYQTENTEHPELQAALVAARPLAAINFRVFARKISSVQFAVAVIGCALLGSLIGFMLGVANKGFILSAEWGLVLGTLGGIGLSVRWIKSRQRVGKNLWEI
ncbi:MAG: hypothetical protein ABJA67_09355 [Chthonomonadales bacterium]